MRTVVYHVAASLDNFICHLDGSIDGFTPEGDHVSEYLESLKKYDTVIMGRATYEFGYRFGLKPGDLPYPHMRHYVFSKSLQFNAPSEIQLVRENELEIVRQLKAEAGTPIYLCGGGTLAGFLLRHQLIDELIVKLNPVILGAGISMFEGKQAPLSLHLLETKTYSSGVSLLHYRVVYETNIRSSWQ